MDAIQYDKAIGLSIMTPNKNKKIKMMIRAAVLVLMM